MDKATYATYSGLLDGLPADSYIDVIDSSSNRRMGLKSLDSGSTYYATDAIQQAKDYAYPSTTPIATPGMSALDGFKTLYNYYEPVTEGILAELAHKYFVVHDVKSYDPQEIAGMNDAVRDKGRYNRKLWIGV